MARACEITEKEVWVIIDGVVQCGKANVASGIVKTFQDGILDIPFAPGVYNRGDVMTARDRQGAVRCLRLGNLPFDKELKSFDRDKMNDRRHQEGLLAEGRTDNVLVERDLPSIASGQYDDWPLYK